MVIIYISVLLFAFWGGRVGLFRYISKVGSTLWGGIIEVLNL